MTPALLWIVSAWIAADVATGIVHWWEDRYGDPAWPIVGKFVVEPNIVHHEDRLAFLRGGYWERNWTTILPSAGIAVLASACGAWWLATVALFATQANEIHGWAHQKCSRPIRGLQLLGILHSPEQHAVHHTRPFDRHFCVMTDFANPVLEATGFWETAENFVALFGCEPRRERQEA